MGDEKKRGARKFEPPPWEKEAFEALARKKAEEQEALEVLAAAQAAAGGPAPVTAPASQPPAEAEAPAEAPAPEGEPAGTEAAAAEGEAGAPVAPAAPPAPAVDERQVQAMLLELGREETTPTSHIKLISRVASVVTGLAGTGMVIGGISALQTAGTTPVGVMGSSALSVFGLCFVGMAVWVWVRSNQVRGSR